MKFLSAPQYAKLHGLQHTRVKLLCRQGRIRGAQKLARDWLIPESAPIPKDRRRKKGYKQLQE